MNIIVPSEAQVSPCIAILHKVAGSNRPSSDEHRHVQGYSQWKASLEL
jgi:hypothetical protein